MTTTAAAKARLAELERTLTRSAPARTAPTGDCPVCGPLGVAARRHAYRAYTRKPTGTRVLCRRCSTITLELWAGGQRVRKQVTPADPAQLEERVAQTAPPPRRKAPLARKAPLPRQPPHRTPDPYGHGRTCRCADCLS